MQANGCQFCSSTQRSGQDQSIACLHPLPPLFLTQPPRFDQLSLAFPPLAPEDPRRKGRGGAEERGGVGFGTPVMDPSHPAFPHEPLLPDSFSIYRSWKEAGPQSRPVGLPRPFLTNDAEPAEPAKEAKNIE